MKWRSLVVAALAVCLLFEPATIFAKGGSSGGGARSSSGGARSSSGWGSSAKPSSGSSSGWGSSAKPSSAGSSSGWGSSSAKPSGYNGGSSSGSSSGWGSSAPKTVTTTTPKPNVTPVSVSKKPAAPSFDKVAIGDAKKAESRVNYEKSQAPSTTYKTPKGTEMKLDPKDKQVDYLRGQLDQQKWVNRQQRETTFYARYSGPAYTPVFYNDPYHGMFNYWLLSQSIDNMALMMIHHQMDDARVRELYAKNAALEAKVAALRAQGVKPDPTWYPPGTDPDLVYNEEYIDATYNPKPKEVDEYTYEESSGGFWHALWVLIKWLFYIAVALFLCFVFYYVLFEHRW